MKTASSSEVAEQYIRNTYQCVENWIRFIRLVYPNMANYDVISCTRLSTLGIAAKKTFNYILDNDPQTDVIRVSRLLADMHESSWSVWTAFNAQSRISIGTKTVSFAPTALDGLKTFVDWDIISEDPTFDPPRLLNDILLGVTLS